MTPYQLRKMAQRFPTPKDLLLEEEVFYQKAHVELFMAARKSQTEISVREDHLPESVRNRLIQEGFKVMVKPWSPGYQSIVKTAYLVSF